LFYLFTFAINLWHRKFVTADVTAMSLNSQHDMKRRAQDFEAIKTQYVCISAISAEYLQKI